MKRDFLKELGLESEVIDQIMKENGKDIEDIKSSIADKDRSLKDLEEKLREASRVDVKGLEAEISQLKKDLEIANATKKEQEQNYLLEKALMDTKTVDMEILQKLIDKGSIKFTEEGIEGLEEQIGKLKESKPYLFEESKADTTDNIEETKPEEEKFDSYKPEDGSATAGEQVNSLRDALAFNYGKK